MSWISDLAGRAENILNKLDQNAANVLQQPVRNDTEKIEIDEVRVVDPVTIEGIRRNLSSNSLSLSRSLTPKRYIKTDLNATKTSDDGNGSVKSEKLSTADSNLSSRRSSISSRADGTVIEQDVMTKSTLQDVTTKSLSQDVNVERELAAVKIILAEITSERNELQAEVYGLQEQIKLAGAEARMHELERMIDVLAAERDEFAKDRDRMKLSSDEYIKSISELETNLSKVRKTLIDLTEKSEWQAKEIAQKAIELQEYRKKAQSSLQMKEKLIEELKAKGSNTQDTLDNGNEKILNMEIIGLRQENADLSDELKNLINQMESSNGFIEKLERQLEEKSLEMFAAQKAAHDKISVEQQRSQQFESENRILNQELVAVREEMTRQRQSFSARLHEKDNTITKLHTHASEMPGGFASDTNNLENRMQSLTQALVKKQASIETVTADRNALRLQLEKVEDQLRHVSNQQRQQRSQVISVNDTDDAKAQLPLLMRENPFDTNVARRVKRAYTSLDSAGIRLGVFLRRYPLIRIMVFIYVAFLHLWVMFVLLSSTPT